MERLVSDTHAPTHNTWKLKIQSVLKCDRQGETERFNKDVDNRMLLWHGSRLVSLLISQFCVSPCTSNTPSCKADYVIGDRAPWVRGFSLAGGQLLRYVVMPLVPLVRAVLGCFSSPSE